MPIDSGVHNPNIATGWAPEPQLHAPDIGSTLAAILRNRQFQQEQTQKNIADTIKQIQGQRQGDAYAEALRNAGLTQGQDISSLDPANATKLAQLILAQTPDTAMDAYHQAAANKEQAMADWISQGKPPGTSTGVDLGEHPLGDIWTDPDSGIKLIQTRYGPKQLPTGVQSTTARPPSETDTYRIENELNKQKENFDLARQIQQQKDKAAKRANVPFAQEDQYQKLLKEIEAVKQRRVQPQASATPPPADQNLAPGYGVPAQEPNKPVTPGEQIDPATVQQYIQKAGGDRDKARELARADGWAF